MKKTLTDRLNEVFHDYTVSSEERTINDPDLLHDIELQAHLWVMDIFREIKLSKSWQKRFNKCVWESDKKAVIAYLEEQRKQKKENL